MFCPHCAKAKGDWGTAPFEPFDRPDGHDMCAPYAHCYPMHRERPKAAPSRGPRHWKPLPYSMGSRYDLQRNTDSDLLWLVALHSDPGLTDEEIAKATRERETGAGLWADHPNRGWLYDEHPYLAKNRPKRTPLNEKRDDLSAVPRSP